jgi:prophage regulatory protein
MIWAVLGRSEDIQRRLNMSSFLDAVTVLRRPKVEAVTGGSRSAIYQWAADGLFTKPIRLGSRAVGWPAHEVATINAARIAGKSNDEIRELVELLHLQRSHKESP